MANNGVCGVGVAYNARIGGGCRPWPPGLWDDPSSGILLCSLPIHPVSATFLLWILLTARLFFRGFLVTQKAEPPVLVALCCGVEGVFLSRSLPNSSLSTPSPYMAGLDHHAPLGPQRLILVQNV